MRSSSPPPFRVLLRHADAGSKSAWVGNDEWRGLSELGRGQAGEVAARLMDMPILRILSSPSLRCRQSVVPLARELVVDVEPCWQLGLSAQLQHLLRFLDDEETASSVLCTHRETLEMLFAHLTDVEAVRADGVLPISMAAAWILHGTVGREPVRLECLPAVEVGTAQLAG